MEMPIISVWPTWSAVREHRLGMGGGKWIRQPVAVHNSRRKAKAPSRGIGTARSHSKVGDRTIHVEEVESGRLGPCAGSSAR